MIDIEKKNRLIEIINTLSGEDLDDILFACICIKEKAFDKEIFKSLIRE